ncbi:MAG: S8 family serine peptidase, partial [Muribaculaceae bacterium]|nr:S8 family serine peptidase [Muribaculaceae bacterium]
MNLRFKYLVPLVVGVTFVSHADNMSNFQPLSSKLWMSQRFERGVESDMVGLILNVNDDFDIESYRQNGMLVTYQSGNVLYATMPADVAKMLSNDKNVLTYRRPRQAYPTVDVARQASGVDELHKGVAINDDIIPYTGKGVVIGIVDGGINPQHIAFNDAQGQSRIMDYVFTQSAYETEDNTFVADHYETNQILSAPIDYECEGHGTHTASIAAGQCPQNLYYGVAPDADLVLTTMGEKLYDDEIIYGIDAAIDYAERVKRPLVVSLSLGSALGPHDGTGEMTDFLAQRLSDKGQIVCFAAGNDGNPSNSFISLAKNFSNDNQPLSTCFARAMYGTPAQSAYMQVWSEDERLVEICLHVIDLDSREIVYTSEYFSTKTHPQMSETLILSDTQMPEKSLLPELANYFDGVALIAGGISNQNGKHIIELLAEFEGIDEYSQYVLGFSLKSDEGANVLLETNASTCYFRSYGIEGFVNGNPNNSISDYCSSPYVISVGSWNARSSAVDIEGNENFLNEDYFGNHGAVANYSSYGPLIGSDKTLPHVLAPGTNVVAAVASGETIYSDLLIKESDGHYWGTKTGTSMA